MGAQWRKRGEPQHAGSYLCPDCCVGRRSARFSLLPFCQTASAFRLICLFHTFFRCGGYRAMVFAPLRCPKLFRFPFACLRVGPFACFAHHMLNLYFCFLCGCFPKYSLYSLNRIAPFQVFLSLLYRCQVNLSSAIILPSGVFSMNAALFRCLACRPAAFCAVWGRQ